MTKQLGIILSLQLFICFNTSIAQNKIIDSLQFILKTVKTDTSKVNILNSLADQSEIIGDLEKSLIYAKSALTLAKKIKFSKGEAKAYNYIGIINCYEGNYSEASNSFFLSLTSYKKAGNKIAMASCYNNLGAIFSMQGNYTEALKNHKASLKIAKEFEDKEQIAASCMNIGAVYDDQGNYPEAIKYYLSSLKINELLHDRAGIASCYSNLGIAYGNQCNYKEALKNQLASLRIREELGLKRETAKCYINIGVIYNSQGNYPRALENYYSALKINLELEDNEIIAALYDNIGNVYINQGNNLEALKNHTEALKLREKRENKQQIAASYINIGSDYVLLKNYTPAKFHLNYGLKLAKEIGKKEWIKNAYVSLAFMDSAMGNWHEAYINHKLYILYKDSLINEENTKKTVQAQMNYEFDKKEQATKLKQEKKDAILEQEMQKQKLVRNSFMGGFGLLLMLAVVVIRAYHQKQKANDQLEEKNKTIELQKKEVEHKNEEITSSIEYALRIQTAILPPQKIVKQYLENSFILYKPKDIVAGDFFWMETIDEKILFAACDCTGHGVPGAMVSVLCHSAINRAVREFRLTRPSDILDKTNEIVIDNFSKSEEIIKDGMDISLCTFHPKTKVLEWAGANNPLWIIKNKELIETRADKQPIGKSENYKPFTNHLFELNSGDTVYIFSDGYSDQFGGESVKKLTKKRFRELILSIQSHSMQKQGTFLDNFITEYRNQNEQTDDILVMGVQI